MLTKVLSSGLSSACASIEACAPVQGLEGSSTALQEQVLDAQDRIDKKLLRMFQSAVKAEKVVRALELASQLSAVRSLEGALKLANHHRYKSLIMLSTIMFFALAPWGIRWSG